MKRKFYFVEEVSNKEKLVFLAGGAFVLGICVFVTLFLSFYWYEVIERVPLINEGALAVKSEIMDISPTGLFYAHFIGGLFFVPSPEEVIFYYGLVKGNPIILSFSLAVSGYMLAQVLNYYAGVKLAPYILPWISKRKLYKARRSVDKYGAYGIFIFNLVPSPAPLLSLALGLARYNKYRLFSLTLAGKILKYLVVIAIFLFVQR